MAEKIRIEIPSTRRTPEEDYPRSGGSISAAVAGCGPMIAGALFLLNAALFNINMSVRRHNQREYEGARTVASRIADLNGDSNGETSVEEWAQVYRTLDVPFQSSSPRKLGLSQLRSYIEINRTQIPKL